MSADQEIERRLAGILHPDENEILYIDYGLDHLEKAVQAGSETSYEIAKGVWWLLAAFGVTLEKIKPGDTRLVFLHKTMRNVSVTVTASGAELAGIYGESPAVPRVFDLLHSSESQHELIEVIVRYFEARECKAREAERQHQRKVNHDRHTTHRAGQRSKSGIFKNPVGNQSLSSILVSRLAKYPHLVPVPQHDFTSKQGVLHADNLPSRPSPLATSDTSESFSKDNRSH